MKRFIYALIAVAATLSFAACNQEEDIVTGSNGEKTIAFTIGAATRAAVEAPQTMTLGKVSLGEPIEGQVFSLEETVTSLDDPAYFMDAETRGTPLYTENFNTISGGKFKGLAFPVSADFADKKVEDASWPEDYFEYTARKQWERQYEWDPWFGQEALLVYAKMLTESTGPASASTVGVLPGSYRYSYNATDGQTMSFSYRSPITAQDQQDILFAARPVTAKEAKKQIPILFYHALTGVKFATAHANDGNVKTFIKQVSISGIYGYGKCYVKSTAENGGYSDTAEHSSQSAITWDNLRLGGGNAASAKQEYYQAFSETPVTYDSGSGSFSSKGDYPESFSAGGRQNNLNDGDATMTFWFIPQTLTDDTVIKIVFEIQRGTESKEYTRVVKGTDLNNIDWKAGQLRTYTLKATEVDVEIEDEVHGFVKDNVVITNTGNVDAYIRAHIVANWWGKNDTNDDGIALGYLGDETEPNDPIEYAPAWTLKSTLDEDNYGGTFTGLPGTDWVYAKDGFFYYTKVVPAGETTGSPLFGKYELVTTAHPVPIIWYNSTTQGLLKFTQVRLVMDIPVQAIQALKDDNGVVLDYKANWAEAGVTVVTE